MCLSWHAVLHLGHRRGFILRSASAKSIFVAGTASHVGKSWMATAICRYLRRRGLRVAPFKAQNMSNNSAPLAGGGEIGRAQLVQAEACGVQPTSDMNPILLKPSSDSGCQVILNGKVWRNLSASTYYEQFEELFGQVLAAYSRLAQQYEYIVIEGAGSVAELNLRSRDLVNFGLATRVGAPALLVGDIDRGGIFASLIGTIGLLTEEERNLVRAFAVNRFRGDMALFADGVGILEEKTGRPCLGVFPMLPGTEIDAEDGVNMDELPNPSLADVAVVSLPRISNITDFQLLRGIRRITTPVDRQYRCIILPGTKSTMADLQWMRDRGLDTWILNQHAAGARIIGICGGYQMMGETIEDPGAAESNRKQMNGLGLLPVNTVMEPVKTTRQVQAVTPSGVAFSAYEIHMGVTARPHGAMAFAQTEYGPDGMRENNCVGTYLHGALENAGIVRELLDIVVEPRQPKQQAYDSLAEWFETSANIPLFNDLYL
ncbi:MAG: cobyric acid synthase [Bryobacteraceae bacterium]